MEDRESQLTELDDDTGPTAEAGHGSDPTMQAPDRQQFVSYHNLIAKDAKLLPTSLGLGR